MHDCRLYLVTPPVLDADQFAPSLDEALGVGEVAAVLLQLAAADERTTIRRIKRLAPIAQDKGAALIVAASPEAAIRGGADGAHLAGTDLAGLRAAAETLKLDRILGAGDLVLKHDAMAAGEAGVDYVMFGEPRGGGRLQELDAVIERVSWWVELFVVPCVAFAPSLEAAVRLIATGAEFIALGDAVWAHPDGPRAAVERVLAMLDTKAMAR